MRRWLGWLGLLLCGMMLGFSAHAAPFYALTVYGSPKYRSDFTHFEYVNPHAPKGGRLNLAYHLPFDTLNGFALKGTKAPGIFGGGGIFKSRVADITLDALMAPSLDEAQTLYPLIAQSVEEAPDFSWVIFHLNPKARFHDGTPITAEDVVFTFTLLSEKGDPSFKVMFQDIASVTACDLHRVRFDFKTPNLRQLPLTVAQIPILSRKYWRDPRHAIDKSTLSPPLGSGAYRITQVDSARGITFERVKDYWAQDLPVNRGQNNFDILHFQVFRDPTIALEGIKSGQYDVWDEHISRNWAMAYDIPAVVQGRLIKQFVPHRLPTGDQAFVFNVKRFSDQKLRRAIALAFDFEWTNRVIFYNAYLRNRSFFENTDFAATSLPDQAELALLSPFRKQLPLEVFTQVYSPPSTGDGVTIRDNLLKAQAILDHAGYVLQGDVRVDPKTGKPLNFKLLSFEPSLNRVFAPFFENLKRLGIRVQVRVVEIAQYQLLLDHKDFDMATNWYNNGLFFPGAEQRAIWGCDAANTVGSSNITGVCNPALEALFSKLEQAKTLQELQTASHALDRILQWSDYTIPQWRLSGFRLAYWDKFGKPEITTAYDPGVSTWWEKK